MSDITDTQAWHRIGITVGGLIALAFVLMGVVYVVTTVTGS